MGCQLLELGGKRLTTYARSKGYEAKTISQPLSWRQDMIQRLSLIIRTCGRNHPAPSDRSCCSWPSHAGTKEGNVGSPGSGSKEGGTRAEVQSARAYNNMQHLTMANASPSERAAESRVIPAELKKGCPNRASVYWQQTPPCGLTRAGGNYHPIQIPQ